MLYFVERLLMYFYSAIPYSRKMTIFRLNLTFLQYYLISITLSTNLSLLLDPDPPPRSNINP